MAQPIPLTLPPRDPREALFRKLENAPQDHAEALLAAYDVLQKLHDRGVLDMVRGGLGSSDQILKILIDATNTPEAIRGMRNLIILAKMADSLDPELLAGLAKVIPDSLAQAKKEKPLGLVHLLRKFRSPDSRRVLTLMARVLEALGRGLGAGKPQLAAICEHYGVDWRSLDDGQWVNDEGGRHAGIEIADLPFTTKKAA